MTLHLLPNLLNEFADKRASLVPILNDIIYDLDGFFVENPKEARKYLKCFDFDRLRDKPMIVMGKRAESEKELLEPLKKKQSWGVISDAGLPCLADPGSQIVSLARRLGIKVKAYPGPCSITHALALSGFDGNGFTFHGYFPRKQDANMFELPGIHIFIETPYNNNPTIRKMLLLLKPRDLLCVACDLMSDKEEVIVEKASSWLTDKSDFDFHKRPAILIVQVR